MRSKRPFAIFCVELYEDLGRGSRSLDRDRARLLWLLRRHVSLLRLAGASRQRLFLRLADSREVMAPIAERACLPVGRTIQARAVWATSAVAAKRRWSYNCLQRWLRWEVGLRVAGGLFRAAQGHDGFELWEGSQCKQLFTDFLRTHTRHNAGCKASF